MANRIMKKAYTIAFAAALATAAWLAPSTAQTASTPMFGEKPKAISVRQALTLPDQYKDKRVLLVGIFMGFSGSCSGKSITRNDVMIQEKRGLCIFASGPMPDGFNANSRKGLGENIVLAGYVVKPKTGAPYFLVSTEKTPGFQPIPTPFPFDMNAPGKTARTIDEVLLTPEKFIDKIVLVTGIAYGNTLYCSEPFKPRIEGFSSYWNMTSSVKDRCLWIAGNEPGFSSKPKAVSVSGTLVKIDGKLVLLATSKDQ